MHLELELGFPETKYKSDTPEAEAADPLSDYLDKLNLCVLGSVREPQ